MRIVWIVENEHDSQSGKLHQHYMDIDDDDLAELHSVEAKNEFIEECVQDEFERTVTFSWRRA